MFLTFHRGWGYQWVNSGCDKTYVLPASGPMPEIEQQVLSAVGEGRAPADGMAIHSHFIWDFPLKLLLIGGAYYWWRRRRAAAQDSLSLHSGFPVISL